MTTVNFLCNSLIIEIQAKFDFKPYWKEYSCLDNLVGIKEIFLRFEIINFVMDLITNLE